MRVKISVSGFASRAEMDDDGTMALNDGATVRTVYRKLKIPLRLRPLMKSWVNYEPARMGDKLKDGDEVMFLILAAGG